MRASDLVAAMEAAGATAKPTTHSFLLYGPPKTGKTELVATVAEADEYDTVYWFDIENGFDTVIRMYRDGKLSLKALQKIIIIKVPDTREDPVAITTLLKTICSSSAVKICELHGRVGCATCEKEGKATIPFDYKKLTKRTAIVIDSLSQAGASALNLACKGRPSEYKPGFDEYGAMGKWLADLCTTIQAAQYCDIYAITHVQLLEDENKNDIYVPLCGTKNFSAMVAKYFGTVVFVTKKLKRHRAESSTLASMNTQSGSRLGIELEKETDLDLVKSLRSAGFLSGTGATVDEVEKGPADAGIAVAPQGEVKPSRFGSKA